MTELGDKIEECFAVKDAEGDGDSGSQDEREVSRRGGMTETTNTPRAARRRPAPRKPRVRSDSVDEVKYTLKR